MFLLLGQHIQIYLESSRKLLMGFMMWHALLCATSFVPIQIWLGFYWVVLMILAGCYTLSILYENWNMQVWSNMQIWSSSTWGGHGYHFTGNIICWWRGRVCQIGWSHPEATAINFLFCSAEDLVCYPLSSPDHTLRELIV